MKKYKPTFEEFQASGRDVEDLNEACESFAQGNMDGTPTMGRVYDGNHWIVRDDKYMEHNQKCGRYSTIICNEEPHSNDLEEVEFELWRWMREELKAEEAVKHFEVTATCLVICREGLIEEIKGIVQERLEQLQDVMSVAGVEHSEVEFKN